MSRGAKQNGKRSFRWLLGVSGALILIGVVVALAQWQASTQSQSQPQSAQAQSGPIQAVVYKTPTCGCCTAWEEYLQKNGVVVDSRKVEDLGAVKQQYGVPRQVGSCHTALIAGYVVEGHVPMEAIQKLLSEKPKVKGISVPGMPMGSPGMEGAYEEKYDVVTFDESGKQEVFMSF